MKKVDDELKEPRNVTSNMKKYCTMAILFYINLINYSDRFTIAGNT